MPDKRNAKTQRLVKEALLVTLETKRLSDVTVSELAAKAGISRSTLYCNFQNTQDIYEALVADFFSETRTLGVQLRCKGCESFHGDGKVPYCVAIRQTHVYRNVVRDSSFLPTMFNVFKNDVRFREALSPYLALGLTEDVAESLLVFQMSGCYAAALNVRDDNVWAQAQSAIDVLLASGMNAIRA